jgi:hypothetical protein
MKDFFKNYDIQIGDGKKTVIQWQTGVFQDGTLPTYRDVDGKLWAISGHSHAGHIAMFCGTKLDDLKQTCKISTNFCVGHADYAFSGVRYPEGVKARGSIWPFGLYICPKTHRFFAFFHNESGWNGKGTAYDSYGLCNDKPRGDSDFRHIGLMHSDDEGKNWTFDRWVLTANEVCFTDEYTPDGGQNVKGQNVGAISLGSGDFTLFVDPYGEYMYLIYDIIRFNMETKKWISCDAYIARTRKRDDGVMGDFVKYYNGAFCEAGNLGKETPIVRNAWHAKLAYLKKYGVYSLNYCNVRAGDEKFVTDEVSVRVSKDMVSYSDPLDLYKDGKRFGDHYSAICDTGDTNPVGIVDGDEFAVLLNPNGGDMMCYSAKIVKR